jgi:hypothetical protein
VVVFARFEFSYKTWCCFYVRHNGIFKLAYCGFIGVAAIEENHFFAPLLNKFMYLSG